MHAGRRRGEARGPTASTALQDEPAPEPAAPDSERAELTIEAVRAYEPHLGSREGAGESGPRTEVDAPAWDTPGRGAPGTRQLGL